MNTTPKYTDEELELLDYIENENPKSIPNLEEEVENYRQIFRDHVNKRRQVSLRFLESDLHKVKTKAIKEGIPYQTLISSILHKYLNGELVAKER